MQNEEKHNRLEVKKTLLSISKLSVELRMGYGKLGCQDQRCGVVQQGLVPQQMCAAFLAGMELTSPEIFTSVQVKAWPHRLNYWVNKNQGEQFPYLSKGTIRLRSVINHGKTQIRIRMYTTYFSGF